MSPSLEDMGPPPTSLEEPRVANSEAAGPVKQAGATGITHESVAYTSAAERCETCEYFDEGAFQCKKNNFECEPQGHCKEWKVIGDSGAAELPAGEGEEEMLDLEGPEEEEEY